MNFPTELKPGDHLELHPLCEAIDEMDFESFKERVGYVQDHPELMAEERVTLTLYKGKWVILDGRHTRKIAAAVGLNVKTAKFDGTIEEAGRLVSLRNIKRRHLDAGRRGACELKLSLIVGEELSVNELAQQANISKSNAHRIQAIADQETLPGLLDAVADGEVKLGTAARAAEEVEKGNLTTADVVKALKADDPQEAVKKVIAKNNPNSVAESRAKAPKAKATPEPCPCVIDKGMAKCPTWYKDEETGKQVVLDAMGKVAPDGCGDHFGDARIPDLIGRLEAMRTEMKAIHKAFESYVGRVGFPWISLEAVRTAAKEIEEGLILDIELFADGLPYVLCPSCEGTMKTPEGKACKSCRVSGYWPLAEFNKGDNYKKFRPVAKSA